MHSPKNYLILLLALTTAAGAALAWSQYQKLLQLRASSLGGDERAEWQRRLWAAEKRRHELEASLASLQPKGADSKNNDAPDGAASVVDLDGPARRRGGPGGNMAANFAAMMDKPEIQKLMAIQQKAALDSRYAALFKNLNLSPAQLEQFKNLLVEKQTAMTDALAAARAQGINPRTDPEDFQKLVTDAQAEADASIKSALGDAAYAQYQQYQQTLPQRGVVNQLAQSLSYTSTPLTSDQSEQLVQILAANTPPAASTPGANTRTALAATLAGGLGFGGGLNSTPTTNDAITQAQTVLAPPQVQALQQLQAAQQAQTQLNQAMRNQFRNAGTTGSGTPTSSPPPAPKGPGGG